MRDSGDGPPAETKKRKPKLDPQLLPANKHAPTPLERQRAQVAKLLQEPTREIQLPKPPKEKSLRPPREMMKNVQGSSAGAGSGEFHVYKQSRRREYERLRLMDENEQKEKERLEFEMKQQALQKAADQKTSKNRAKRQKRKQNRLKKGSQTSGGRNVSSGPMGPDQEPSDSDTDDDQEHDGTKKRKVGAAPACERVKFKHPHHSDDEVSEVEEQKKSDKGPDLPFTDGAGGLNWLSAPVVEPNGLTVVDDEI